MASNNALIAQVMVGQQNQITSYLDGSMIYGSGDSTMHQMRLFKDGLLNSDTATDILQASSGSECHVPVEEAGKGCFKSGDKRVNEQPGLALYHIIWHR